MRDAWWLRPFMFSGSLRAVIIELSVAKLPVARASLLSVVHGVISEALVEYRSVTANSQTTIGYMLFQSTH